ncbi:bile acid:sodium symporter family protein [Chromatocurvus halotolerans]|uniref:BASS family bile acid:Na+ symporter n=1 Tax=Chromatocurvus halotolerans TaxID=1132028 RepID=A0A4R2KM02_9GAMM|nr:bile acid:sodium symporter family protein [Chromatocurvus halotolerans]TCO74454.1 BASS family bile acid:Na+ symporter [Chromatocurvus halotolerans]
MNQDLVLAIALPLTLFIMMFSMGANLSPGDFRTLWARPSSVLCGLVSQMLLLPVLAFLLLSGMSLPPEIMIGFMILALSPGGTTSNVFSYLVGGNLALSIALTAIVSLITPFSLPLVAGWIIDSRFAGDSEIALPFLSTVGKLTAVTLVPVTLGMILRHYRPALCERYEFWMTRIPFLMLLAVIGGIIAQNWARMPEFLALTAMPALLLASAALAAGYALARGLRRDRRDARTIAIETSIQNGGTAILVTGTILGNPAMTIAPVMYGILMLLPVMGYLAGLRLQARLGLAD